MLTFAGFSFPRVSALCAVAVVAVPQTSWGQTSDQTIELMLRAGRSMRVALDRRVTIHQVGQPIDGTLVEAVYVYDRVVLPIGTRLTGCIARVDPMTKKARAVRMIGGDFSPHPRPIIEFDRIVMPDGQTLPIETVVKGGTVRPQRHVARGAKPGSPPKEDEGTGPVSQVRDVVTAQAEEALALLRDPGKMARFEEMAIEQLPYHPEFLHKGTVYDVELLTPLPLGRFAPLPAAPSGSAPAPDSVLTAKLTSTIDSATTPRGTPIGAVLTEPVFSRDHEVIFPEGTALAGQVTFAKPARRWHHNGQLRVLFASVQPPAEASRPLLASLYSVEAAPADRVSVDEEGGTTISNSKTRFIPPALALLALRASVHQGHELDDDDVGVPPHVIETQANPGARALGGMFGFGVVGAIVGQLSRPVAIAVSAVGVARTLYTNIFAKGREVAFRADTPIQVRLAPGPSSNK